MKTLIDLVNFNADASCLSTSAWLRALEGGGDSMLCRWLGIYVALQKKVMLGFTGATVADMRAFNPESIALINAHPEIFELMVRPFSHDISLLRSRAGFLANLDLGMRVLSREFQRVRMLYLPPEFKLTNEQVALLAGRNVGEVVVNAARFSSELQQRIPAEPYCLKGIGGSTLRCLPAHGALTQAYLDSLHQYDATPWSNVLDAAQRELVVAWRDGESPFLIPNGVEREHAWLSGERAARAHLSDLKVEYRKTEQLPELAYHSYPVHSFTAWMKEFRMLGYVTRLQRLEEQLGDFDQIELALWLQAINSDVLSAVEKMSPIVTLKRAAASAEQLEFVIHRSERGFEGEEYLVLLETLRRDGDRDEYHRFAESNAPTATKFLARLHALEL